MDGHDRASGIVERGDQIKSRVVLTRDAAADL